MDKITDFHTAALYFIKYTKSIWGIFPRCGRGVYRNFIFQWVGKYIEYIISKKYRFLFVEDKEDNDG